MMHRRLRPTTLLLQFAPLLSLLLLRRQQQQVEAVAAGRAGSVFAAESGAFVPLHRGVDVYGLRHRHYDDGFIHQFPTRQPLRFRQHQQHHARLPSPSFNTAIFLSSNNFDSDSILSPSDTWGNIATLAFSASLAQLLGKTTTIGKLLGAPVTAMALTFVLSSVGLIPTRMTPSGTATTTAIASSTTTSKWKLKTLLPPGGSPTSSLLQGISLTLATPLLLLGGTTGLRRRPQQQEESAGGATSSSLGPLLASFTIASLGTLLGSILAISLPYVRNTLQSSLTSGGTNDGIIIASALLAKNIGGGINYMAVCACLGASTESIAAGLCVDNVMALAYFPYVSYLASKYEDVAESSGHPNADADDEVAVDGGNTNVSSSSSSSIESFSHAFTLAAVLTSLGQFLNSKLHQIKNSINVSKNPSSLNLSLPITTLLTVLFSMYYPPNIFLSPTTTTSTKQDDETTTSGSSRSRNRSDGQISNNAIAQAGETLGTSLLYLFFATAGAPGWRLKDSIRQSFPSIASFLMILYGVHGMVLWGCRKLIMTATSTIKDDEKNHDHSKFWKMAVAPQRLLVASSAAIGGPATAAALAKSVQWESLVTPGLLVGNIGYAVATFIGLLFYSVYR
ncbi:hypothetical protein ACHAWU_006603 [Discostella pseudostelligera]|uniref:Uncharacterized protein n=1 Tax=Discostella pseudostelligera TaxID=259834 RepID=A0ABD3M7J6_9STRA